MTIAVTVLLFPTFMVPAARTFPCPSRFTCGEKLFAFHFIGRTQVWRPWGSNLAKPSVPPRIGLPSESTRSFGVAPKKSARTDQILLPSGSYLARVTIELTERSI